MGTCSPHRPIMAGGFLLSEAGPCVQRRKAIEYQRNDRSTTSRGGRALFARDVHLPTLGPLRSFPAFPTHRDHKMLSSARTGASLALRGEFAAMLLGVLSWPPPIRFGDIEADDLLAQLPQRGQRRSSCHSARPPPSRPPPATMPPAPSRPTPDTASPGASARRFRSPAKRAPRG